MPPIPLKIYLGLGALAAFVALALWGSHQRSARYQAEAHTAVAEANLQRAKAINADLADSVKRQNDQIAQLQAIGMKLHDSLNVEAARSMAEQARLSAQIETFRNKPPPPDPEGAVQWMRDQLPALHSSWVESPVNDPR